MGDASEVIDQCGALIEAGARHISFGPPLGADSPRAVQLLGEQVLPVLRDALPLNRSPSR